jgi:type I restriction enzyme, S subunit
VSAAVVPQACWPNKRLKFCASYNDEVLPESTDDFEPIEYVEISDVSLVGGIEKSTPMLFHEAPSRARRRVRGGDILVSTVRTYLKAIAAVSEAPNNLIASTGFCVVRPNDGLDAAYAGWVIKSEGFVGEIVSRSVGVSYPAINASQLVDINVPLPPTEIQSRIATFLDEKTAQIDALIEKKRSLLDRLAEKRQAIITQAVTKGLNPGTQMKDSGIDWLGQMPAHWKVWPLKRVIATAAYGVSASLEPTGEVAILRMGNLQKGELDFTDLRYLDQVETDLLIKARDVIFNRTNSLDLVGKAAIYRGNYEGQLSLASYLVLFRFDERYDPEFANYVMGADVLMSLARTLALPSIGQANLNPSRYAAISFPVPPLVEQRDIARYLACQLARLSDSESQIGSSIERLSEFRSALITAAVNGQIEALQ